MSGTVPSDFPAAYQLVFKASCEAGALLVPNSTGKETEPQTQTGEDAPWVTRLGWQVSGASLLSYSPVPLLLGQKSQFKSLRAVSTSLPLWTSVLLCEVAPFYPAFLGLGRKGGSVLGALSRAFAAT